MRIRIDENEPIAGGGCRAALGAARAVSTRLDGVEQRFVSLRPAEAQMRAAVEAEGFEVLNAVPELDLLRAIAEEILTDVMFDLPTREDVEEVKITEGSVIHGTPPLLEISPQRKKKEA